MEKMHSLLTRQMKRHLEGSLPLSKELTAFIEAVNDAYIRSDIDRRMLERSLELSSKELTRANSEMRAIIQAFPDILFRLDPEGRILDCNPCNTEDFYCSNDLRRQRIQDIPSQEAGGKFQEAIARVKAAKEPVSIEYPLDMENGKNHYEARLLPFIDGQIFVIIRNITDHIRMEEEKDKLKSQLLQSQKMQAIGTLAGGIAHDFNNLLTAIMGYGNLVQEGIKKDDPLKFCIDQIVSASEKAAKLTQGLLTLSRKQIVNPKPVNLNEIVKDVAKLISRIIGEDIEYKITLSDTNLTVMADSGQLEHILVNLSANARDSMPDGGILSIRTETVRFDNSFMKYEYDRHGAYACISVTDTGVGMDEETKGRIFDPFFTTKEVGKGTGLGLSIVHGIVEQHGGHINVYSEQGKGTTFRIYFPLTEAAALPDEAKVAPPPARGSETILVAEDDDDVRLLIKNVLEKFGYNVIEAVDGKDAVKIFEQNRDIIELILSDVVMPGKNGREAYEEIKKIKPDIKVIFMSGYPADIINRANILEKEWPYLEKPALPSSILKMIREVLDR